MPTGLWDRRVQYLKYRGHINIMFYIYPSPCIDFRLGLFLPAGRNLCFSTLSVSVIIVLSGTIFNDIRYPCIGKWNAFKYRTYTQLRCCSFHLTVKFMGRPVISSDKNILSPSKESTLLFLAMMEFHCSVVRASSPDSLSEGLKHHICKNSPWWYGLQFGFINQFCQAVIHFSLRNNI